jgi:hypothetical protein
MTPRIARACSLTVVLLVGACQPGAGATTTPTLAPTGAEATGLPSEGPSAAPTATPAPIAELLRLNLATDGPVIRHEDGPAGSAYALPAGAARARDGSYVVVVVWFPADNGPSVRTLARSEDGRSWKIDKTPVLNDLGVGGSDPGPIPAALLDAGDEGWQMYGWADDPLRSPHFDTWRASASRVAGPWTLDGPHVIETGRPGTWDSQTTGVRSVLRTETGFAAWYEGSPPGSTVRGNIGYASSSDGLAWEKYDDPSTTTAALAQSDPVLRTGICGHDTSIALFQPHVERDGDRFDMVFGGFGRSREQMDLFGAISTDGIDWTCGTPEALLKTSDIPESEGIHTFASFPLDAGRMGLLVESLGPGYSDIWLATVEPVD